MARKKKNVVDEVKENDALEAIKKESGVETTEIKADDIKAVSEPEETPEEKPEEPVKVETPKEESKEAVSGNIAAETKTAAPEPVKLVKPRVLTKGDKVITTNANMYEFPNSKIPSRAISGTLFIADGASINGRYAVVRDERYVGDDAYIVGYINIAEMSVAAY